MSKVMKVFHATCIVVAAVAVIFHSAQNIVEAVAGISSTIRGRGDDG